MIWAVASTIAAVFMATLMIFIRMKAAKKPASVKKIILPPFMMSTGALMFLFPQFQVSWIQVLEAVSVGIIFSVLLIVSSKFEIKGNDIYLIPSKAFVFILFGLLALRIILKTIVGQSISFGETSGMFFLLAFGMIISWRTAMLLKFLKLKKQLDGEKTFSGKVVEQKP
ncbi:membrane protein CcdC involved in cytochrome C biogenesis [Salirhabdus euzebyi]|uniref:Membrane protein CcdC involved in cytochrome C biogenesis n=1 Tax=Salirhabdus euzebyi TaxID=394506 RepID=A0A841PUY3_9BACI|nr:cytochrome c biogenesis protein CcdC [Salirhabdus euzebyi]MBB6452817.1 membrane protein CcdC involved in cytochrome C biogenesis [Salirhabdus euzebyi]